MMDFKKISSLMIAVLLSACSSTDNYCTSANIEQLFQRYLSEQIALMATNNVIAKEVQASTLIETKVKEVLALVDIDIEDVKILNKDTSKRMGQCTAKLKISVPPPLLDAVSDNRVKSKQSPLNQYAKELGLDNKENVFIQQINYVVNIQVNPKDTLVKFDSYAWEHLFENILNVYMDKPLVVNVEPVLVTPTPLSSVAQQSAESEIIPEESVDIGLDNKAQLVVPSFDCHKAVTPTDKTICATTALASLDVKNMTLYKQAKLIDIEKTKLIWRESIKYKYACGTEINCIRQIYEKTIALYSCVIKNASCQNDTEF